MLRNALRWWRNAMRRLNQKQRFLGLFVHILTTIAISTIFFSLIVNFAISASTVEGSSMEPTLSNGDKLIIYEFNRRFAQVLNADYVPKRGEIIIFRQRDVNHETLLVKRIVGLPGEEIEISHNKVIIYNQEFPEGFEPDFGFEPDWGKAKQSQKWKVKQGQIFVLGDNRGASTDSREIGPVNVDRILGVLILRILPVDQWQFF